MFTYTVSFLCSKGHKNSVTINCYGKKEAEFITAERFKGATQIHAVRNK
jgi:hypothetical protein